jgi:putative endonuclease
VHPLKNHLVEILNRITDSGFFRSWRGRSGAGAAKESTGTRGERLAAGFLKKKGWRILYHSYSTPRGELDLIATAKIPQPDGSFRKTIVFVEVKTWTQAGQGGPSDAVHADKQRRVTNAALEFLKQKSLLNSPARIDVIEVVLIGSDGQPAIRHFENAFDAVGNFQMYS